jgi:16S rRNA (adenine1518-N6/adenine1519-N6)-dimethyltransferase
MALLRQVRARPDRAHSRVRTRRLGQHFLVDDGVAARIVAAAELAARPPVLEIGPGKGALTAHLRNMSERLYLVEIDPMLASDLRARYDADPGVVVIEGDMLALDVAAELPPGVPVHVVGNLPYSVASQILLRLVELRDRCPLAVVMLQREVAQRVAARPGGRDYGVLTLLVQLYATVEPCFRVSPGCFQPRPQVESAVLRLRFQSAPRVPVAEPALFRQIVRGVFQQRRKMIRNTLAARLPALGVREDAGAILAGARIEGDARPERLDLQDFARLTDAVAARRQRRP